MRCLTSSTIIDKDSFRLIKYAIANRFMKLREACIVIGLTAHCGPIENGSNPNSAEMTRVGIGNEIKHLIEADKAPKDGRLALLEEIQRSIDDLKKMGSCPLPTDSRLIAIKNRLEEIENKLIEEKIITSKTPLKSCTLQGLENMTKNLQMILGIHLEKISKENRQLVQN